MVKRCSWVDENSTIYKDYHDHEWGKPVYDDEKLYEAVLNETLLHKWASVEEIAEWAYFVTVINKSMTAEDLLIDNGEVAKFNFIW